MKKWKVGSNPKMDKKLRVGMIIWFKSYWASDKMKEFEYRISIGKIISLNLESKMIINTKIIRDIKKSPRMGDVEWGVWEGSTVGFLSDKEQLAYMI